MTSRPSTRVRSNLKLGGVALLATVVCCGGPALAASGAALAIGGGLGNVAVFAAGLAVVVVVVASGWWRSARGRAGCSPDHVHRPPLPTDRMPSR